MKISVIAAARVFVCDNMAFSGSSGSVVLSRKHTSGLELAEVVPPALDCYLDKAGVWKADIGRMHDYDLSDERAKSILDDGFLGDRAVLPLHLLYNVHNLYFNDEAQRARFDDRSLWSLNNAFTEAVKLCKPIPQQRYGVEIGRYFGKILHAGQRGRKAPRISRPSSGRARSPDRSYDKPGATDGPASRSLTMWSRASTKATAGEAARMFAAEAFERPRRIRADSLYGDWYGKNYCGQFQLIDGDLLYVLRYNDGMWSVQPHCIAPKPIDATTTKPTDLTRSEVDDLVKLVVDAGVLNRDGDRLILNDEPIELED